MSKANGTIEKKDTYLQHVSLKNYKSIKDAEIDFKPGLNIIIGKNSSGKTNFINALDTILNFEYDDFIDSESIIKANINANDIVVNADNLPRVNDEFLEYGPMSYHKLNLMINGKHVETINNDHLRDELYRRSISFSALLVPYGIKYDDRSKIVNNAFTATLINNWNVSRDAVTLAKGENRTEFVQHLLAGLYVHVAKIFQTNALKAELLKIEISSFLEEFLEPINSIISKYSSINAIRIFPDFHIVEENEGSRQTIKNFFLEFQVESNWITFDLLSDGSKRLFYIISELISAYAYNDLLIYSSDLKVILLEEPELGIHPHQLHLLMQFIKEQSRYKQIILTTHSPQVLDIIETNELDRVIICNYDSKNGTQLRHLSEKEMSKAKKYMTEEAFLSDYWRFSDLEPAS
ncbi:MAG TPA: AAA family ATPase [Mucilaginibacter sp.]|jgi:predicted ATPase|nr:AAA family ATPase [Mucilaginibacter sp.]